MDWFGQRYGWTPQQVEDLPAHLYHRLPVVAAVKAEIEAEHRKG